MTRASDGPFHLRSERDKERFLFLLEDSLSIAAGRPGGGQISIERGENGSVSAVVIEAKEPVGPVVLSLRVQLGDDGTPVPEWSNEAADRTLQERAWCESMARLSEPLPSHNWWAAIEPVGCHMPASWYEYSGNFLGGLELRFEGPIVEMIPDKGTARTESSRITAPWVLRGAAEGINFYDAIRAAVRRLDKITGLLSVVTGQPWHIRRGPEPIFAWPGSVPHIAYDGNMWLPSKQMISADLNQMLCHMDESEVVTGLVLSFAHALRLRDDAPSLCFLAFAAVVERVGFALQPSKPCQCCENCKIVSGAAAQFREGLSRAGYSKTKTKKWAYQLYKQRSTIAHSAALFGEESSYAGGMIVPRIFGAPPSESFVGSDLKLMQFLCQRVLASVLIDSNLRMEVINSGVN